MSIAYNAALQAAKAALFAAGYRAGKTDHHYRVIQSLAYTINAEPGLIQQLDKFRKKRNISDYERTGMVTDQEVKSMIMLAEKLKSLVTDWLKRSYPELISI